MPGHPLKDARAGFRRSSGRSDLQQAVPPFVVAPPEMTIGVCAGRSLQEDGHVAMVEVHLLQGSYYLRATVPPFKNARGDESGHDIVVVRAAFGGESTKSMEHHLCLHTWQGGWRCSGGAIDRDGSHVKSLFADKKNLNGETARTPNLDARVRI